MKQSSLVTVIIIVVAVLLLVWWGSSQTSGYTRTCLSSDSAALRKSPVDYAFKEGGWQQNPHWQAKPEDPAQPLEYGPVDFYPDDRRLNELNGQLFQQYDNDWGGCGNRSEYGYSLSDPKFRYDLREWGQHDYLRKLERAE